MGTFQFPRYSLLIALVFLSPLGVVHADDPITPDQPMSPEDDFCSFLSRDNTSRLEYVVDASLSLKMLSCESIGAGDKPLTITCTSPSINSQNYLSDVNDGKPHFFCALNQPCIKFPLISPRASLVVVGCIIRGPFIVSECPRVNITIRNTRFLENKGSYSVIRVGTEVQPTEPMFPPLAVSLHNVVIKNCSVTAFSFGSCITIGMFSLIPFPILVTMQNFYSLECSASASPLLLHSNHTTVASINVTITNSLFRNPESRLGAGGSIQAISILLTLENITVMNTSCFDFGGFLSAGGYSRGMLRNVTILKAY
eukprot:PhF_6_TR17046/c1_g1_i1/m.25959